MYNTFTKPAGDTEIIIVWKSKGLSNEIVKPPTAPSNSLTPKLKRIHNSKIAVEFHGSYLKQDKATFSLKSEINLFIVYRSDVWSKNLNTKFTLGCRLFEAVKLTKNADLDKYGYSS